MSTRRTPALPPVHHLDGSSFVAATRRQALAGILAPDASSPQLFHGEGNGCRMRTSCQSQYGSACFCADTSAEPAGTRHGRAPISRRLRLSWPPSRPNKIPPRLARGEENKCFFLIRLSVWETPESTGKIAAFCTRSDERRSPPGLTGLLNRTHPLVVPSSAPANDC